MLSKTKGVITKCLGSIKQDTKIAFEQIKPYVNFYLKVLLGHLYILNQYINFNFKNILSIKLLPSNVIFEVEI